MRRRRSCRLGATRYDPQSPLRGVGFAKQRLNKLQCVDPLCLRFLNCFRAGGKIAQVETGEENNVYAIDRKFAATKISRAGDIAILPLQLKLSGKRPANTAAIGKDKPGRRRRF